MCMLVALLRLERQFPRFRKGINDSVVGMSCQAATKLYFCEEEVKTGETVYQQDVLEGNQ